MPCKPRLFLPQATSQVYCRVARGESVFDDPTEADSFVGAVQRATLLDKHQSSLTRWHNRGLKRKIEDQQFRDRICDLDAEMYSAAIRLVEGGAGLRPLGEPR